MNSRVWLFFNRTIHAPSWTPSSHSFLELLLCRGNLVGPKFLGTQQSLCHDCARAVCTVSRPDSRIACLFGEQDCENEYYSKECKDRQAAHPDGLNVQRDAQREQTNDYASNKPTILHANKAPKPKPRHAQKIPGQRSRQ